MQVLKLLGLVLWCAVAWARPEGAMTGHPWVNRAQTEIEDGRFDEALVSLRVDLKTPLDRAWHGYLEGCALIGKEQKSDAQTKLEVARTELLTLGDDAAANRLLSRVERKLGYLERERGDYAASRTRHYIALDLAQRFGSAEEEHDCLISIDVDCWHMQEWPESERVLRQSVEAATQITDAVARVRAQATSANNLAGTLAELRNFEEAQEQAQAALIAWTEWEQMTGDASEFRIGWAHYTLADVYLKWAATIEDHLESSNKKGMAKYELIVMRALAQEAQRPQSDFDAIDRRFPECE
ncbi:MAG: hypothetical protein IPG71_01220 [bacterium]|nr:hypothetical protein [bacterium]